MSYNYSPSVSPIDDMAAILKRVSDRLASLERASSSGGGGPEGPRGVIVQGSPGPKWAGGLNGETLVRGSHSFNADPTRRYRYTWSIRAMENNVATTTVRADRIIVEPRVDGVIYGQQFAWLGPPGAYSHAFGYADFEGQSGAIEVDLLMTLNLSTGNADIFLDGFSYWMLEDVGPAVV